MDRKITHFNINTWTLVQQIGYTSLIGLFFLGINDAMDSIEMINHGLRAAVLG